MTKISEYVDRVEEKLERKKNLVSTMVSRYNDLMNLSDHELALASSNDRILINDPVYNSEYASDKLKQAIETRKLGDMTQEEFENAYKQVLHGISNKEKKELLKEPSRDLIKHDRNLDIIPRSIPLETLAKSRHSESYLLRKCKEYELTLNQLNDLTSLKNEYSTNFPKMLSLIDDGFSIEEIGELLEARDQIASYYNTTEDNKPNYRNYRNNSVTLKQLALFHRRFDSIPINSSSLAESVMNLHESAGCKYVDQSIKLAIEKADESGVSDLETIVDFISDGLLYTEEMTDMLDNKR